jgi:hypothetical protein
MRKPNFLIVGAAKCGTTSLFEYLRRHPDVYMPAWKELSYFAGKNETDAGTFNDYLKFFSKSRHENKVGEASVAYLYASSAPLKIASALGKNTKIIILLRNPVEMAHSLWAHNRKIGVEHLNFEDALDAEATRMNDRYFASQINVWLYNFAYVDRAKYAKQIERYLNTFGLKNVRVYIYETFFDNITESLKDVYEFLEIDTTFKLQEYNRYNVAGDVRSKYLRSLYAERKVWTEPLRWFLPIPLRRTIIGRLHRLNSKPRQRPPISPELRNRLRTEFTQSICDLEKLLDIQLTKIWR